MAMSKSHFAKSRLLEEIIIELRRKGLQIPANVMSDLKSARTLMKINETDSRGRAETEPKIDIYIGNVEAYVVSEASKFFSTDKVEKWLTELDIAACDSCVKVEGQEEKMRMIPGVPRDQKWIRAEPIESLPIEKLEQMAKEDGLSYRREKDGRLIVYGADKAVKGFIKKISKPNEKKPNNIESP
jgi:hypothetical protein